MSKESMEVLARMTNTDLEIRETCDRWIIITYDLPHNEEGDKARYNFLQQARSIGATRHTDSVYLLPWTPVAEHLALDLARVPKGNVVVWTSKPTDESKNIEITRSYDESLEPIIQEISERIDHIVELQNKDLFGRANRMMDKTAKMIEEVDQAIIRRGSMALKVQLDIQRRRFALC